MATSDAANGREMTVGGVLGRAFSAIGAAPARFLGTSFVLSAIPSLISEFLMRGFTPAAPGAPPEAAVATFAAFPWASLIPFWLVFFFVYLLGKATLIRTTAMVEGQSPAESYGETVAASLRTLLPLVGATILWYIGISVGMMLLFVPGLILALMWAVTGPVIVQEGIGVFAAFGRSRWLTKGARLRIFGLYLVVFVVYLLILSALAAAGVGMGLGMARMTASPSIISTVLTVAMQTAFLSIWTAMQASLYLELCDWKDGVAGDRLSDIFA